LKVRDAFFTASLKDVLLCQTILANWCCPFGEQFLRFARKHIWPKYRARSGMSEAPESRNVNRAANNYQPCIAPSCHLPIPFRTAESAA
jgi:hypothetical protein